MVAGQSFLEHLLHTKYPQFRQWCTLKSMPELRVLRVQQVLEEHAGRVSAQMALAGVVAPGPHGGRVHLTQHSTE